jgi:HTH-type transcriptional regulator/antitoxin HigA
MRVCKIAQIAYNESTMKNTEHFKTPGQLLSALLEERGWTNRLLASVADIEESGISRMVLDKKPITADVSVIFQEIFNIPAERFLNLQKSYDLAKARIAFMPDPNRSNRAKLFGDLPISEMMKRGWIDVISSKNTDAIEQALITFFDAENLAEIKEVAFAAKKTNANSEASPIQLAWFYRVKKIAQELIVPEYNEVKLKSAIQKLKPLLIAPEEARNVPKIMADCGIRFVIVEALKSSKIDGVCFWLDEYSPVIGMSLRFDRMDNFWFVLRHELEHVLQRHGMDAPILDIEVGISESGLKSAVTDEEAIANLAAAEFCVPKAKIDSFIARKAPLFPTKDFIGFSKLIGVHPCLVAGQIQFRTSRYELFRNYLEKIREHVIPSAIVDGWGDVFPFENR